MRKIYYNITVTSLSVAVALVIGVIELVGLLGDKLDITSGPVAWIGSIDLDDVGFWIVGLFVVTWARGAGRVALRAHRGALVGGAPGLGAGLVRTSRRRAPGRGGRR